MTNELVVIRNKRIALLSHPKKTDTKKSGTSLQEFWLFVNVYFLDSSVDFSGSLVQTTVTFSEETPAVAGMVTDEEARSIWPSSPQYLS